MVLWRHCGAGDPNFKTISPRGCSEYGAWIDCPEPSLTIRHDRWTLDAPSTRPNHPPTVVVNGHDTLDPLRITVHRGETITLDASDSFDIDGDTLQYEWFQYKEAETFLPVCPSSHNGISTFCCYTLYLPLSLYIVDAFRRQHSKSRLSSSTVVKTCQR